METYKFGRELEPGDVVLDLLGRTRMLTSVEPYPAESPLADLLEGARIGTFDGGWRMTLEASARFTVATVALDCDHETSVPGPAGTPTGRAWCSVCGESRKVAA